MYQTIRIKGLDVDGGKKRERWVQGPRQWDPTQSENVTALAPDHWQESESRSLELTYFQLLKIVSSRKFEKAKQRIRTLLVHRIPLYKWCEKEKEKKRRMHLYFPIHITTSNKAIFFNQIKRAALMRWDESDRWHWHTWGTRTASDLWIDDW